MKNNIFKLLILLVCFSACTKEETAVSTPIALTVGTSFDTTAAAKIATGNFTSAVHTTTGRVTWYQQGNKQYLYLTNFATDAGPDLKVYIAKNTNGGSFVNIGNLASNTGNQVYEFTGNINPTEYPYILIWCQRFSVLFGSANIR